MIKKAKSLIKFKSKHFRLKFPDDDFLVENVWIKILSNF